MGKISRRDALIGGSAVLMMSACDGKAPPPAQPKSRQFPADFIWGTATSAFQIEGALEEDGRGPSVWDLYQKKPGVIIDGSTAAVADDSYHRYAEDIALLKDLGCKAYRFSIAWPRVLPTGQGTVNDKGLDYYKRLVDGLLERGIAPYATLFHWDLPQALYEKGGWNDRDTAQRLADYAGVVGKALGDRVKHFIILNEAAVHTILGHVLGLHAPGLSDPKLLGPVTHHQNLGQGLSITALRAIVSDARIGTSMALMPVRPSPGLTEPLNAYVAHRFDEAWNKACLDPLLLGTYPKNLEQAVGGALRAGDHDLMHQKIDFLGVNFYSPAYARFSFGAPQHIATADPPAGAERDAFKREIDPSALTEVLDRLRTDYGNPEILITENGCSDAFSPDPAVMTDQFRIDYLRRHLEAVRVAMEKGSPVRGYMVWSIIDNWEWNLGFSSKFGLCDRIERKPKASFDWFRSVISGNAV